MDGKCANYELFQQRGSPHYRDQFVTRIPSKRRLMDRRDGKERETQIICGGCNL